MIDIYKRKLFDDYHIYLDIIEQLNKKIPYTAEDMGLEILEEISFDYVSFCTSFMNHIKNSNENFFIKEKIILIFEEMIYNIILTNEDKTKPLYEYDLDDENDDDFNQLFFD